MNYKNTLNLPKTAFPMKANLQVREPKVRETWEETNLYERLRELRRGREKYVLHDGPPYPTGELHIGTGLNKILKDMVVRYQTMRGKDSPFVPGWDCHGLPIEHKVMQELGPKAKEMTKAQIRKRCRQYAERYVDLQRKQFKALGVMGSWDRPYLTLQPEYEAAVIDVFAALVRNGCVYRSRKPIHWCMNCETALAEAELNYDEKESPSIFVAFEMEDDVADLFDGARPTHVMIWTTTPWTLPANMAVAVHPYLRYAVATFAHPKDGQTITAIVAKEAVDRIMNELGIGDYSIAGDVPGKELEGKQYKHVFTGKFCPFILAEYVALSEGTGCVHTAPGHGAEDFVTGLRYGLDAYSPVTKSGTFTDDVPHFAGQNIFEANPKIVAWLWDNGALLKSGSITHSYPHCWRCDRPVIFRATDQWFVALDKTGLRKEALDAIRNVKWMPAWGEARISSMVADRPDWCISRQRSWGIPIPAFYCKSCGKVLLDADVIEFVRDVFRKEGADSWFVQPAEHFLPPGTRCSQCGGTEFTKETDIFDVWFESGSSFHAVVQQRKELTFPADLYLEGTDQHRGWFQLSLLACVGSQHCAPYKAVLTHGFVVDERGEKMSKSKGNFISVEDALKRSGADVIRLWTSSMDARLEMNTSHNVIARASESYRKVRNTFRFLLANTSDFSPATDAVPLEEMLEIDRWALDRLQLLIEEVTSAFEDYEFHRAYRALYNFCTTDMSAFYLDILKDRLYTEGPASTKRRSAQTVLYEILLALTKLWAPILVHTTEEVWAHIQHKDEAADSVHTTLWPQADPSKTAENLRPQWDRLVRVRDEVLRELEKLRKQKIIGAGLEATVILYADDPELQDLLSRYVEELPSLFIVSEAAVVDEKPDGAAQGTELMSLWVKAEKTSHAKCVRCWNHRASVGQNEKHPELCARCVEVVESMTA